MKQLTRRKLIGLGAVGVAGLALPVGPVQSVVPFGLPFAGPPTAFGWHVRQWYGNTRWAYRQRRALYGAGQGLHFGVDFFANCGTPVQAIGDGTIIAVDGPYGSAPHNLVIRHANGYASLYGHLQQRAGLRAGQVVRRGENVGISGVPTGADCDTHPHLHLEIRTANLAGTVNPVNFIEADWSGLTLGLSAEGLEFELDLNDPLRWQSIYDQPDVRFGGPLLNDFARPWPG